jgi:hypothetical protein
MSKKITLIRFLASIFSVFLVFLQVGNAFAANPITAPKEYDSHYSQNNYLRVSWSGYSGSHWLADNRDIGGSWSGNTFTTSTISTKPPWLSPLAYGGWAKPANVTPPLFANKVPWWDSGQTASENPGAFSLPGQDERVWGYRNNEDDGYYRNTDGSVKEDNRAHGLLERNFDGSSCTGSYCYSAGDTTLLRREFTLTAFEQAHVMDVEVWATGDDFSKVWIDGTSSSGPHGSMERTNSGGTVWGASPHGTTSGNYGSHISLVSMYKATQTSDQAQASVKNIFSATQQAGYKHVIAVQGTNKVYKRDKGNPAGMEQGGSIWYYVKITFDDKYQAEVTALDQNNHPVPLSSVKIGKIDGATNSTGSFKIPIRTNEPITNAAFSFTAPTSNYTYTGMDYHFYKMNPDNSRGSLDDTLWTTGSGSPPPGFSAGNSLTFSTTKPNTYVLIQLHFTKAVTSVSCRIVGSGSDTISGELPLSVTFTASDGASSYAWDFDNNGTTDATTQTASHTYTTAGQFSAKVTASGFSDTCIVNAKAPSSGTQKEVAP